MPLPPFDSNLGLSFAAPRKHSLSFVSIVLVIASALMHSYTAHAFRSLGAPFRSFVTRPALRTSAIAEKFGSFHRMGYGQQVRFSSALLNQLQDTIYAISSGSVTKSGVSVIRTSGPGARPCLEALLKQDNRKFPEARKASLRDLRDPESGSKIDKALVLWFPGPNSFTGEDIVEYHVHGSPAVVNGLLTALEHSNKVGALREVTGGTDKKPSQRDVSLGDHMLRSRVRPAEPGEFTRRAFEYGKMDLTEVEALSDLLESQTELQRVQALNQMEGHLKNTFERWRSVLTHCLAHMEAVIDFGDDDREGDITEGACDALYPKLHELLRELQAHLDDGRRGEIIRDGFRIVIAGPPNAGKSSIMNKMARRPVAIVSPEPGTTRDVIEVRLSIGGVYCLLTDTAGLRSHGESGVGAIEIEGMNRARELLKSADLKLYVCDSTDFASQSALVELLDSAEASELDRVVVVMNKVDAPEPMRKSVGVHPEIAKRARKMYNISCLTGEGFDGLEAGLKAHVMSTLGMDLSSSASSSPSAAMAAIQDRVSGITRQRHRFHVEQCIVHIRRFLQGTRAAVQHGVEEGAGADDADAFLLPMDARAEELRLASMELGRVTGRVDVEELLDIIFRDFCIGK